MVSLKEELDSIPTARNYVGDSTTPDEANKAVSDEDYVKSTYPDSFCDSGDLNDYTCMYWIEIKDGTAISEECGNEQAAWSDAANRIKSQQKS